MTEIQVAPTVVLITSQYPFGAGEQFISAELEVWARQGVRVIMLPEKRGSVATARPMPPGIELCTVLADRWDSPRWQIFSALRALGDSMWWRELGQLIRTRRATPERMRIAMRTSAQVMLIESVLAELSNSGITLDVVYGYWLSAGVFAGARARRRGLARVATCRAHGTDLWEPIRQAQYTPLVRQLASNIDLVGAISLSGSIHLARYGFTPEQCDVARLGVDIPDKVTAASGPNSLKVVSVSSLTPLKRVDRIIHALARLRQMRPDLSLSWTHIGSGPLAGEIQELAAQELGGVEYEFIGQLDHDQLFEWYRTHEVDVVVNSSDSEGIPVTLMEAMVRGVPAVAPAIGAVDELVLPELLLPPKPSAEELSKMLSELSDQVKSTVLREKVRRTVEAEYCGEVNHTRFVHRLLALMEERS